MRISKRERSYIEQLVDLGIFDDHDIVDILLVWSGFKPAALVDLSCSSRAILSRSKFYRKVRNFEEILENLKLLYQLRLNYPKTSHSLTRYSFIARNQAILKKLIIAEAEKDLRKRRELTGGLLGYPKTAVRAFSKGESVDTPQISSTTLRFLNFRLSKQWRKEIKYVHRRAEEIKRISPELYKRITKNKK